VGSGLDVPLKTSPKPSPSLVPVYVGAGIAVLGAVGFTVFELAVSSDSDTRARLRAKNGAFGCADMTALPADCAAESDAANSHDRNRNWATVSAIVGAAGLISIPVYLLWQNSGDSAATANNGPRLHAAVSFGRLSLDGTF